MDSRLVRGLRDQLAERAPDETRAAVATMLGAPHSTWGELLVESLVRAVRSVVQARERLPAVEERLKKARAERAEIRDSSSPTKARRLDEKLADVQSEFDEYQASLRQSLRVQDVLLDGLTKLASRLDRDGSATLGRTMAADLRRYRAVTDRTVYLEAMGRVGGPSVTLALMDVVRDKVEHADSVLMALVSLTRIGDPSSLPAAIAALEHKDWRVQAQSLELTRIIHRRSSIPFLVERLQVADGRLRDDIGRVLNSLTGKQFASDGPFWARWWEDHRGTFEMPPLPTGRAIDAAAAKENDKDGGGVKFYGITTHSKRVLFVLDVSGSMAEPARTYANSGSGKTRKIDVARRNLRGALMALPEDALFNVILYADGTEYLFDEVVPADADHKQQAIDFVYAREPRGGTNIHAALVESFRQSERVARATKKDAAPRVDTMYFLTDGQPTVGTIKRPDEILREARSLNELRRIRIHAVGVGSHDKRFMARLAEDHGGEYVAQ